MHFLILLHDLAMNVLQDKGGKETNGFKSRMGSRGPAPRLLRLKVEDTVLTKGAPLTKGKFTWITQAGREERWIVANCGNYTVLWNFRWVVGALPLQCCSLDVVDGCCLALTSVGSNSNESFMIMDMCLQASEAGTTRYNLIWRADDVHQLPPNSQG
jgi:hypothetical protein